MRAYIIRRLLILIPTMLLLTLLVFTLTSLIPGDIVTSIQARIPEEVIDRAALEKRLGLDKPLLVQYGRWMGVLPQADGNLKGVFQGDFGISWWRSDSVVSLVKLKWPITLELGILGLIFAQLIALPVGVYSALRQDKWGDYAARTFAILCISVPGFWLGTLIIVFPAIWWGYMPPLMLIRFADNPMGNLQMFIIPAVVLGMAMSGFTMRMTRTMMLEVLRQDYIRTAWAKGLRERVVILRHALKNAMIPVVTGIGLQIPVLVGGTVIIENIFNLPGMGRLIFDAISQRDEPVVGGVTILFSAALVLVNLVVDVTYGFGPQGSLWVTGYRRGNGVAESSPAGVAETKKRSYLVVFLKRLVKEKPLGAVGALITLILLFTGIFADFIAPYGMNENWVGDYLAQPSPQFWFGTDNIGRDFFSRVIFGARISVIVGLSATTIGTFISVLVGVVSGYIGGTFDLIVQRFVDGWMSLPTLIVLLIIVTVVGPSMWSIIILLGLIFGIPGSRIIRGAVIGIKENAYVQAARAVGCSTARILTQHILPNIMAPVIVLFSIRVPAAILTEASLSFLGFGIPPPDPSWGGMLSNAGRTYMTQAPWLAIWPGLALAVVVFGVNMFGDAVRDLVDPRLTGGAGRFGVKVAEEVRARIGE